MGDVKSRFYKIVAAQRDVFFLWWPVFFGIGIGAYFGLRFEPPLFLSVVLGLCALAGLVLAWRSVGARVFAFVVVLVVSGFMMAQVHTIRVASPMLAKKTRGVDMVGVIEALEALEEGAGSRMILKDLTVEGMASDDMPRAVRVRVRKDEGLKAGQRVAVAGQLMPPSAPILPGGFDFQRYMFFKRIGAVGFIYYAPEVLQEAPQDEQFLLLLRGWRSVIAQRVQVVLGEQKGAVATALLTAERSAIAEEDTVAMRESGLAHILAISGLHIGLFSGVIFFIVRLVLAVVPGMALHYPIKKYAAVIAFAGACFYGMLAGFPVSTQRALIMLSVVYLAVLLDRSPFSMRLVAFAALAVLVINPAALMGASFQLSFAAVAALIVVYEWLRPFWSVWYAQGTFFKKVALYFIGVCLTTVIASTATAPLALYHFQQVSMLGNAANLVAVPMMAFVVMPFAVLALFLMPFGLEGLPLQGMGWGIGHMLETAHYFSSIPGAIWRVRVFPLAGLLCLVFAFFGVALLKGWVRMVALPLVVMGVLVIGMHQLPDILMAQSFDLVMVRGEDERLYLSSKRKEKFVAENWQEAYGREAGAAVKFPYEGVNDVMACDASACRMEVKGRKVSFVRDRLVIAAECGWADVVISDDFLKGAPCKVLSKSSGYRGGAHAVYLDDMRIETTEDRRGLRPWVAR